ncbi:MAG: antibiotic biosynthesis monooxygenase [Acidimicrobiaceae bacterium]|nr:antibiotic biosynthesis monooxygenase [Acidimicrobiaceae bacterium]
MTIAIVQGVFAVSPEDRERFLQASLDGMRSARSEEGCLEYVLAADPLDPGRVVLSERWESMEHLQRHIQGLGERQRQAGAEAEPRPAPLSREITVYEVAGTRSLG